MTEQRYTLEEAQAELARRTCHVTGHQIAAITYGRSESTGPVTYECGRCSDTWMMQIPVVGEGEFTLRLPMVEGADDEAYRRTARMWARTSTWRSRATSGSPASTCQGRRRRTAGST